MAQKTIQIADKPTLDAIKTGVDALTVSSGDKKVTTKTNIGTLSTVIKRATILLCSNPSGGRIKYICIDDVQNNSNSITNLIIQVDGKTAVNVGCYNTRQLSSNFQMSFGDSRFMFGNRYLHVLSNTDGRDYLCYSQINGRLSYPEYEYPQQSPDTMLNFDIGISSGVNVIGFPIDDIYFKESIGIYISNQKSNCKYGIIYDLYD